MNQLFLCLLTFIIGLPAFSQSNQPPMDPTYGLNGMVKSNFGLYGESVGFAGLPLPDGSMLVAGSHDGSLSLSKLKASGKPDSLFAVDGVFNYPQFKNSTVLTVTTDADNRILLGGRAGNSTRVFSYIIRLDADGKLDPSWDYNGVWTNTSQLNEELISIMVSNKRVIACSNQQTDSVNFSGIVRFFSDSGQIDSTAFSKGTAVYGENAFFMNLFQGKTGLYLLGGEGNSVYKPVLIKINENGFVDSAFGVNGKAIFNQEIGGVLYSITEDNQGFLIGGGEKKESAFRKNGFLVKLKPQGFMENSFGVLGNVNFSGGKYGNGVRNVTAAENNTFFVTGYTVLSSVRHTVFMNHYDSKGNPVNDFGTAGYWEYKTDSSMSVWDVRPDPLNNKKMYLIGTSSVSVYNSGKYFIMRMNLDPKLTKREILSEKAMLGISPNPAAHDLPIVVDLPEQGVLMVTDFAGKMLYRNKVTKGIFELPREAMAKSGAYIVVLQAPSKNHSSVLVVE